MDFRNAFCELRKGRAIRLPTWRGYWLWENDTIMMHCKDGSVIDIRYTRSPDFTFSNIASLEWEVCEPRILEEKKDEAS